MLPSWIKSDIWNELANSLSNRFNVPVVFDRAVFGKLSFFQELRNRLTDVPFGDVSGVRYVRVKVDDSEVVVGPFRTNEPHAFDEELADARSRLPEWNDSFADLIHISISQAVTAGKSESVLRDSLSRAKLLLEFSQAVAHVQSVERGLSACVQFLAQKFKLSNVLISAFGKQARYFDVSVVAQEVEKRIIAQLKSTRTVCSVRNVSSDFLLKGIEKLDSLPPVMVGFPIVLNREVVGHAIVFAEVLPSLDGISEVLYELSSVLSRLSQFERVQESAATDSLTGLPNRAELNKKFDLVLADLARNNLPVSVVMIDVDNFKKLNDTKGHLEGDRVLKEVAAVLKSSTPDGCMCARYGGEEFALFLPNYSSPDAKAVAELVRSKIESACELTVSLGVMTCMNSNISRDTLIREADRALYRAKDLGKNRVVAYLMLDRSLGIIDA